MPPILNRRRRSLLVSLSSLLLVSPSPARADIFQWEYIDPSDPSQGKQQSTTLAPDGAGVDAVPGAYLSARDLTMAHLDGEDLNHAELRGTNLQNASLRGTNLEGAHLSRWGEPLCGLGLPGGFVCRNADATYADFSHANLTNADFNRANASGADFREANLTNVTFFAATLIGANLARQSFTNVELYRANMSNADFTGADLTGADNLSYAYFSSATLTGANLSRSSLWGASFSGATLTEADLTEAYVHGSRYVDGANFSSTTSSGFTASQLYSTASYQRHNLTGIGLNSNNLSGWNFAGQNLNNAWLSGTILTGADFTAADARGADLYIEGGAITTNVIQRDGHINGLDLDADGPLVVRDDDGVNFSYPFSRFRPPISITVDQHFMMGPGGTLRMVFEGDAWDSSISFALGIPVTLGGTLELTFADYVNLASQVGRTFDLFDWTGVTPTGAFAISSPYTWDISKLYTTGEVTLAAVPEPTTFALFTVPIIGLTLYRRRNVL